MIAFEPHNTGLCHGNAYWTARLAHVIYQGGTGADLDTAVILADLSAEDPGFRSVIGVSRNSAQAALVEHADYLCLTFRGTDEARDWLDNVNVLPDQALFGSFHRGFLASVRDVWEPLFARLEALQAERPRPLFLTGHSLGGSMATVAAALLLHGGIPFAAVYTYGQPRAMGTETAERFNRLAQDRFFRFQNNNDIVTRAPARLAGFRHVGTYLYISEDGIIHREHDFWLRFRDAVEGAGNALRDFSIDLISDHRMDLYLQAVTRWDYR